MSISAIDEGSALPEAGAPTRWPDGYFHVKDGTKLHYVEAGHGYPVILIHGARGSAMGNWFSNGIAPKLARTNKVYALDMRGHGLSEGNGAHGPFNHSVMPNDVLDFMDHMGIEKAHMAGYSMGSHVLTQLMTMAPERFISVCFQGGGVNETPEWRDRIPKDKEGRDPDQERADEMVKQRRLAKGEEIGNNFSDGQKRPQAPVWNENQGPPPEMQEIFKKREEALSAFDLKTIKFPVMAINGEYDRPLQKTHRLWREVTNFTNLVLPGKGHLTAMMAGFIPDEYIDGYAAFVVRNNPKG